MAWITNVDTSVAVRIIVRRRESGVLLDLVLWAEGTTFRSITLNTSEALQLVDDLNMMTRPDPTSSQDTGHAACE